MKRFWIGVFLITAVSSGCNRGGGITAVPGGIPSSSAPAEVSSSDQVVKVSASPVQITPGRSANAVVRLSISPGFHVNANPATFPYLIATTVTPGQVEGIEAGKPSYPAARKQQFQFTEKPIAVYEGETTVSFSLQAQPGLRSGSQSLPIAVRVQACDHEKCYPPADLKASIPVEVK